MRVPPKSKGVLFSNWRKHFEPLEQQLFKQQISWNNGEQTRHEHAWCFFGSRKGRRSLASAFAPAILLQTFRSLRSDARSKRAFFFWGGGVSTFNNSVGETMYIDVHCTYYIV